MLLGCRATVFSLMTNSWAMARFRPAGGDGAQHLDLPGRQSVRCVGEFGNAELT
ncbi:hypothetical protein Y013_21985 [Rhodococcus pyridinivorans SB3094]|uniref:Uncharacterized protein n=1 Tax=Rhodococcus pyridinivorans SB3094 TaxID=1435356 RepID=V9XKB9_9NOCA|nr:hypothetical protein Y013_21985 [Rhodococcus pyridinivorans SB3094]